MNCRLIRATLSISPATALMRSSSWADSTLNMRMPASRASWDIHQGIAIPPKSMFAHIIDTVFGGDAPEEAEK